MRFPVVLSVIALKIPKLPDSGKATGHPQAATNFPADKGGKRRRKWADVSFVSPPSAPGEFLLLTSHRYKLLKLMDFCLEMSK